MERRPKPGEIYRHFKNKLYQVITIAHHSETGEELVIYQALYGSFGVCARPLDMFVSPVDHEKYPEVTQQWRFELVEDLPQAEWTKAAAETKAAVESKAVTEIQKGSETQAISETHESSESMAASEEECPVHPKLLEFFDADSLEDQYNVLAGMKDIVTDQMIDSMAVALDVVIPDGELYRRYDDLKHIIATRQKYEQANRLR